MTEEKTHYLKEWRLHRGLSQDAVADAIGKSSNYLSELERGKKRYNADILEALADVYECTPSDLLGTDPEASQDSSEIVNIWAHISPEKRGQARQILETFTDKKKA